jgi:hypothetical protein
VTDGCIVINPDLPPSRLNMRYRYAFFDPPAGEGSCR